jgi:hypothetical protein
MREYPIKSDLTFPTTTLKDRAVKIRSFDPEKVLRTVLDLNKNPLVWRHLRKRDANGGIKCLLSVDDVLAEKILICASLKDMDVFVAGQYSDCTLEDPKGFLNETIRAIATSPSYLWTQKMYEVTEDMKVPPTTIQRNLVPFGRMWWTTEIDYVLTFVDGTITRAGALLSYEENGLCVVSVCEAKPHAIYLILDSYMDGSKYPEDYPEETEGVGPRRLLSALAFLNSPFMDFPEKTLKAGVKRKCLKKKQQLPNDSTTFIDLRAPSRSERTQSKEKGTREYQHQWLVTGHIRNQWYAKTQTHKLIWIAPFVKGPKDKPFKQSIYRVKR